MSGEEPILAVNTAQDRLFFYRKLIIVFTAVWMTLYTVAAVVPVLLLVLVIHFVLFMAVGTGPARSIAAGMACLTIVFRPMMVRREGMVK